MPLLSLQRAHLDSRKDQTPLQSRQCLIAQLRSSCKQVAASKSAQQRRLQKARTPRQHQQLIILGPIWVLTQPFQHPCPYSVIISLHAGL